MKSFDNEWEKIHSTQEWGKYPAEHVIRFVARRYYNCEREKIRILDFGCGGGSHTWYLAREGFDTWGFDGSVSAIEKVANRLQKEHLKAHLQVSDALEINYENDFFDAVIDNVCIYANTLSNIRLMYRKIFNVLKQKGTLLTVCFGKETEGCISGEEIEKGTYVNIKQGVLANRGTTHLFDREEIRELLETEKFRNINIDEIIYTDNQVKVQQYIVTADK